MYHVALDQIQRHQYVLIFRLIQRQMNKYKNQIGVYTRVTPSSVQEQWYPSSNKYTQQQDTSFTFFSKEKNQDLLEKCWGRDKYKMSLEHSVESESEEVLEKTKYECMEMDRGVNVKELPKLEKFEEQKQTLLY